MILSNTTVERVLRGRMLPAQMITQIMRTQYIPEWAHMAPTPYEIRDMFSDGQIASKVWLAESLLCVLEETNVIVSYATIVGSWFGTLSWILNHMYVQEDWSPLIIELIDSDPRCADMIKHGNLVDGAYVNADTIDMFDYQGYGDTDIVINTACEHIQDIAKFTYLSTHEQLQVLQSNNMYGAKGHVNCVSSEEELAEKSGLSKIVFQGTLKASTFDRFMVMGYK